MHSWESIVTAMEGHIEQVLQSRSRSEFAAA